MAATFGTKIFHNTTHSLLDNAPNSWVRYPKENAYIAQQYLSVTRQFLVTVITWCMMTVTTILLHALLSVTFRHVTGSTSGIYAHKNHSTINSILSTKLVNTYIILSSCLLIASIKREREREWKIKMWIYFKPREKKASSNIWGSLKWKMNESRWEIVNLYGVKK